MSSTKIEVSISEGGCGVLLSGIGEIGGGTTVRESRFSVGEEFFSCAGGFDVKIGEVAPEEGQVRL